MPQSDSATPEIQAGTVPGASAAARPDRSARALSAVADMAPSPILGLDMGGAVTLFNSAAEVLTGWPLGEVLGRPLSERLLDGPEAARAAALLAAVSTQPPPERFDLTLRTHSGELRPIRWSFRVIRDDEGRPEQLVGVGDASAAPSGDAPPAPRSETSFRSLIELMPDAVAVHREGQMLYLNPACRHTFGIPSTDAVQQLRSWDFVHPDDRHRAIARVVEVEGGGRSVPLVEARFARLDGTPFVGEVVSMRVVFDGAPATLTVIRDITPRRLTEEALRQSEDRFALAAAGATAGLWDWNAITGALYLSPRLKQLLGHEDQDFTPTVNELMAIVHPEDRPRVEQASQAHLAGRTPNFEVELRLLHREGSFRWCLARGVAAQLPDGTTYRFAGSLDDIDGKKVAESRLLQESRTDPLTGLTSRGAFLERLQRRIDRHPSGSARGFAVLFLDVDRFQVLNDSLGHIFGDDVIIEIGRRLQRCVRMQDTVARFGGDEFTLLLDDVQHSRDAARVADRIHAQLSAPVHVRNQDVFATVSVGIAVDDGHYVSPDEILRDADNAMYRAKALGRAQHVIFHRAMHVAALQQLELETDLHRALEREEFAVYYQPIIAVSDGRIVGFEALVRWIHPRRGLLGPADFIPYAEDSGLIVPLGLWVLQRATRDLAQIVATGGEGLDELTMAVNLSSRQFGQEDLVERIREILDNEGVAARRLKLEVTESTLMADPRSARFMLERLRALEVKVCIDDFGTGYSSLSHLRMFPVDTLKIDRSFVSMMDPVTGGDPSLPRSILSLAHQLGLEAIAEGVETQGQLDALRALNCDFAQGFLFERPLPLQAIPGLLAVDPRW